MTTPPQKPSPPQKPDFSNVRSSVKSSEEIQEKADFSNVQAKVSSTEEMLGGSAQEHYTVVAGDTLSHIAKRCYGKASKWTLIYEANRDQLSDPDKIQPGQVLKIPPGDA